MAAGDATRRRRSHGEPDCMGLYEGGECELCLFRRECRLRAWEVEEARESAARVDREMRRHRKECSE
ncbi:MAG TPA: hypothetical protein IAA15_02565 [Candidatus Olsenella pullicola]|nr:hypothetical protein [Candidatus Olsenella pullicola]